jgi:hypothetical protein
MPMLLCSSSLRRLRLIPFVLLLLCFLDTAAHLIFNYYPHLYQTICRRPVWAPMNHACVHGL